MATPTILIVDDTPMNIEMLRAVLVSEGFRTLDAENGPEARRISTLSQPDLILLDVMMPGETGFDTCAKLKSNPATADIPVIFLSALDDVKNKVAGLKSGGVDYITKPMHGEEVLARVRVHLRISANNRAMIAEHRLRLEQLRNAQQAILVRPEDCPEAHFAVYYFPLEEAGGDFYDVVPIGDEVFGYFVADVSGHGVSAAFLTSAVKALLRQYSNPLYSAEDAMRGVDSVMRQLLGEEQYLTACYARLNKRTRRLSVVSAGHPPMIVLSADGRVQAIEADSEPLGVFSTLVLQNKDVKVDNGDRFFLYSDGLTEAAAGSGRAEGQRRLMEGCVRHRHLPIGEAVHRIVADARHGATAVQDDLLLLASEVIL